MKKSLLLSVIAIIVMTGRLGATTVSQQSAQTLAQNFFKMKSPLANNTAFTLNLSYTKTETDGTVDFYVFNASPMKGFVIVSGDDNAIPVIGYSTESYFDANDRGITGITDWITSSAAKIHYVVTNHVLADATIRNLWTSYAHGINPQSTRGATIGPLLTTTWNQVPYYNALCPPAAVPSNSIHKSVTGCVATAMAQIMKYWNYPAKGTGTHSYSPPSTAGGVNYGTLSTDFTRPLYWSAMPNNVTSNTSPVDSLMYELGVAVNMNYDTSGSGAFVLTSETYGFAPSSQSVYPTNFYYNPNTLQGVHLSQYSTAAWITLMENEINAGRVVQYEGTDPSAGGHTWVMDGYEPQTGGDYLHMNWGWGGANNGWFSVTNLATTGFNPSQNDAALIGIEPLVPFRMSLSSSATTLCANSAGVNLTVQAPAGATYSWLPTTGLSCTTCANPIATPSTSTLYTVQVDSAGVTGSASVALAVSPTPISAFTFSAAPSCSLPEFISFNNTSTNATSYVWDFGDGSPTSSTTAPLHSYAANGNYTVTLYATNSCGVDTLVGTQPVQVSGGAPTAPSAAICSGQSASLTATGSNVNWFSDAGGNNIIQSGNNVYNSGPVYSTTTVYIASVVSPNPVSAGPATDVTLGTAINDNTNGLRGLNFNCTVAQTLNSVVVNATGAGSRLFILEDGSGNIIDSATIYLSNGQQTVPLGFFVPVGTNLLLAIDGVANLMRNSTGATYPYTSGDATVTITGNNAAASGRYYYFYDWQLQQPVCTSPIVPVSIYVLGTGGYTFAASGTGSPTVSFTPATTGATSYTWDFGDGSPVSTATSPSHTYAASGTYTVQLIVSNGSCADTVTQKVNTVQLGINTISDLSGLSVSPNPAKDLISVSVNSSSQFNDCRLSINNILGQSTYSQNVNLTTGANKFDLNISNLSPGIYFISLQNGKNTVTYKFVKASE